MTMFRWLKASATGWINDNASMHCAAIAYYTLFSLAPLIILVIAVTGFFFGEHASRGEIFGALQGALGPSSAKTIETAVYNIHHQPHTGFITTLAGIVPLLLGASGVFSQLQQSLNSIWRVQVKPGAGLKVFIRQRLLSFSMILAIGFLLLVSLIASAGLAAAGKFVASRLPGGEFFWHVVNFAVSFGVITLLFAAIYKILPDVVMSWKDVWAGAALTAFLFAIGKLLIGLYLGKSSGASAYGAAGSLIVLLLWVYFSSAILLFGAEFTRVFAHRSGHRLQPKAGADIIGEAEPHDEAAPKPSQAA
jgi:membrane protein